MNLCSHCQAELVCDHVPANRIYQCPVCGCPNTFGEEGSKAGLSKFARKSLLCALVTLLLLVVAVVLLFLRQPLVAGFAGPPAFLLGMIATYFGIRSFLLTRYQPFSKRSKYEAISGVVGGGCLGIFVGGIVSISLIVGLVSFWFNAETSDRDQVAQALQATAKFDFPESIELIPSFARKTIVRKRIELWDDEKFDASRNRLYVLWTSTIYTTQWGSSQQNRDGLRKAATRLITGNLAHRKANPTDTEELEWKINGAIQKVTKMTWQGIEDDDQEDENIQFVTYQCLFDANRNTYCLTFLSELPDSTVSESEIKAILGSFEPVGSGW